MKTKGISRVALAACAVLCGGMAALALTGCPSTVLHNQVALMVTFEFKGFGDASGSYSVAGNFDGVEGWEHDNGTADLTLSNGSGTTASPIPVTAQNIQFSLVLTGDSDWARPWYKVSEVEGNSPDGAKGNRNFYIDELDLDAGAITLVIDASSGTAVPAVK